MKKKKNGFTLVELLVTIALMLTILGIAIVSFVNISNRKKEEAWQSVKAQIETAAEEYFTANEYLFEGLKDTSESIETDAEDAEATGTISVGQLVSDDYINKVTNPMTGEALNECSLVKVLKNGNKITASFDDETIEGNCGSENSIMISTPGAPKFDLKGTCKNIDDHLIASTDESVDTWCYKKTFSIESLKKNGEIVSAKTCNSGSSSCIPNDDIENKDNVLNGSAFIEGYAQTSGTAVTAISLSNQVGTTIVYKGYKIDRNKPTIVYEYMTKTPESEYNGIKVYDAEEGEFAVQVDANDENSGVSEVYRTVNGNKTDNFTDNHGSKYFFPYNYGERYEGFCVKDNVGNSSCTSGQYVVSYKPACPSINASGVIGDDDATYVSDIMVSFGLENGEIYNTNLYGNNDLWGNYTFYNGSYLVLQAEASHQFKGTLYNKYGLHTYCESDIYVKDKTPPYCPTIAYDVTKSLGSTKDGRDGLSEGTWGDVCPYNVAGSYYACPEDVMVKVWATPTDDTVEIDWYTNDGPGDYIVDVAYGNNAITTYWSTWSRGCPIGGVTGQDGCGSWPKMLSSSKKNSGYRQGLFVVRDKAGNANYCLTSIFHLQRDVEESKSTATKCYNKSKLTYDGTVGNNSWYISDVKVKYDGKTLCTIESEGTKESCKYKIGNKTCTSGSKKIDKTKPKIEIDDGPKKVNCGGNSSIQTKYTAKDNISGLAVVKDYYGFNDSIPAADNSNWRTRKITSGTKSFTHDHNWGPTCYTKGTPAKGTCYYLKYYLKDKAGNVTKGKTSNCARY